MKERGYRGNWTSNGDHTTIANCTDPFSISLTLTPPQWLNQELQLIQANKELPKIEMRKNQLITLEELTHIFKISCLSMRQFANKIGVTIAMASYLLNGKRAI